ncbi:MAG: lysophospholipase [Aquabacterium sp.]|uniref:alpha/beta hydrolase n=1 Tax=Aquabacterium sp. TaxID=1872578 RepID=UPI0025C20704|nr:alpha/beta hydrolase [Aquabacterium sp.]MBI3381780.1 lysophospholipase [Aquabacterium sp.]
MSASTAFPATVRTRDGLDLVTQHWPLAAGQLSHGVAILVHGLGEHCLRYAHVAAYLNEHGWAAVGYDHRGHGRSPGKRGGLAHGDDFLHDLAKVVDTTRAAYPGQRLIIVGHSLGGAIAGRFVSALAQPTEAAPWSRPVDGLVLSSPALDVPISAVQRGLLATIGKLTPDVPVGNGLKPEWVCNNPATVKAYMADPLVHDRITGRLTMFILAAGENVRQRAPKWTVPTLIMWGGQDRCVKPEGSVAFATSAPKALVSSQPFHTLSHEIFNEVEQAEVLQVMGDWLGRVFGG